MPTRHPQQEGSKQYIMRELHWIDPLDPDYSFPDVNHALQEPDGLLAAGGDLSPARLLRAYRMGIFPWFSDGQPILWWSPDPRMVLFPEELKVSRSLAKILRQQRFKITLDTNLDAVIRQCAAPRRDAKGTWITGDMISAYNQLNQLGYAHSVEAWQDDQLVGGLYGVALGKVFFGESMFSHVSNASKVAFVHLVKVLIEKSFQLVDCQVETAHLGSLGARNISRQQFIGILDNYCEAGVAGQPDVLHIPQLPSWRDPA